MYANILAGTPKVKRDKAHLTDKDLNIQQLHTCKVKQSEKQVRNVYATHTHTHSLMYTDSICNYKKNRTTPTHTISSLFFSSLYF